MIVTDGIHLLSDTAEDELHEFAQKIGLKRCWFQARSFPHYDLTTERKVKTTLKAGAKKVDMREIVMIIRRRRGEPEEGYLA